MIRRSISLLILLLATPVLPFKSKQSSVVPTLPGSLKTSRFERFVSKIYEDADINRDGTISFTECYQLVLKLYIRLNREAPIPPPSREMVFRFYSDSDINHNRRISRDEFTRLARILGRRALVRLVAHKMMTLIGAPLLAELILRQLEGQQWLSRLAEAVVPEHFLPTVTSKPFCRTFLIVILVATLGNRVIDIVNWALDSYDTKKKPKSLQRIA